jgi:hypothetical protein
MRDRARTASWPLAFIKHRRKSHARVEDNQILPNEANFNLCGICRLPIGLSTVSTRLDQR